jgi:hypothetical protein
MEGLVELLEERFGMVPSRLKERIGRIQDPEILRQLRSQRKYCQSLGEFERLLEELE